VKKNTQPVPNVAPVAQQQRPVKPTNENIVADQSTQNKDTFLKNLKTKLRAFIQKQH